MSTKKKAKKAKAAEKPRRYASTKGSKKTRWRLPKSIAKAVGTWDDQVVSGIVIVHFDDRGGMNVAAARRSRKDVVWFHNHGKKDRELELDHWPFKAPEGKIKVPATDLVGPYILNAGGFTGTLSCHPHIPWEGHPPGDPQFSVDD